MPDGAVVAAVLAKVAGSSTDLWPSVLAVGLCDCAAGEGEQSKAEQGHRCWRVGGGVAPGGGVVMWLSCVVKCSNSIAHRYLVDSGCSVARTQVALLPADHLPFWNAFILLHLGC
jgi:hypothetical protein